MKTTYQEDTVALDTEESRETDSDSDSYNPRRKNTPLQKEAAQALRALANFMCFTDAKQVQFPPLQSKVHTLLLDLIVKPKDIEIQKRLVQLYKETLQIKLEKEEQLRFDPMNKQEEKKQSDKRRYATVLTLYALGPHLRLTHNKVQHGELLQKLLFNLLPEVETENLLHLQDVRFISLFAYWSKKTMKYCALAEQILEDSG